MEQAKRRNVAVVVPLSTRPGLTADEEVSLRHLRHFLGGYDKFVLAPPDLPVEGMADFEVRRLDSRFFGNATAHALLQLSSEFYEAFDDYEFILMYHLDALVFSDQLAEWCKGDFDFIGAPWYPSETNDWLSVPEVGNSGFALMRVRSFLRLLRSRRRWKDPGEFLRRLPAAETWKAKLRLLLKGLRSVSGFRNGIREAIEEWLTRDLAGDRFLTMNAHRFCPEFRIAGVEEALRFSFEGDPAGCFRKNGHQLPFGCHAWTTFDREFWEKYTVPATGTTVGACERI